MRDIVTTFNKDGEILMVTGGVPYQPEHYEVKDKLHHPYDFSPIILFGREDEVKKSDRNCVYDDRMFQWDSKKYDKALESASDKNGMMHWNNKKAVQKLMDEYYGKGTHRVYMVVEWCNVSNGYPYHSVHYVRTKNKSTKSLDI